MESVPQHMQNQGHNLPQDNGIDVSKVHQEIRDLQKTLNQYNTDKRIEIKQYIEDKHNEMTLFNGQKTNELFNKLEDLLAELKLEKALLKNDKDHMDAKMRRMEKIGSNQDEIIELDVGGQPFKAQRKLMMKDPGSKLATFFSGIHE